MFSATHCWTPALVDNSFTFTISADFLYSYIFLQSTTLGDNRFEDVRFSESWVVGVGRGAGRNATHTNLYEQLSYATGFDHSNPMYSA